MAERPIKLLEAIDKYIKALEQALENANYKFEDDHFYKPLVEAGLVSEDDPEILSDPYYDAEAVAFALSILKKLRKEVDSDGD